MGRMQNHSRAQATVAVWEHLIFRAIKQASAREKGREGIATKQKKIIRKKSSKRDSSSVFLGRKLSAATLVKHFVTSHGLFCVLPIDPIFRFCNCFRY